MMELVDMSDLKSDDLIGRVSSSLTTRTITINGSDYV